MRLPRVRFRLWWLMILVAVVALILGCRRTLARRRSAFGDRAWAHQSSARRWLGAWDGSGTVCDNEACEEYRREGYPPTADGKHLHPVGGLPKRIVREWVGYHAAMAEKYHQAAQSPWKPVADDPPEPPRPVEEGRARSIRLKFGSS